MASLDPGLLEWAVRAAAPGAQVAEVRGLRDGGSPWLIRFGRGGGGLGVVLRVGGDRDRAGVRTEVAALRLAAEHRLPAPRLLAAEPDGDPPVVLTERLGGSSAITNQRPTSRLRTLGPGRGRPARRRPGPRAGAAPARPADRQRGLRRSAPPAARPAPAAGGRGAGGRAAARRGRRVRPR